MVRHNTMLSGMIAGKQPVCRLEPAAGPGDESKNAGEHSANWLYHDFHRRFLMRVTLLFILISTGFLAPLNAAITSPASGTVSFSNCNLPISGAFTESFTIATDSGTKSLIGIEGHTFLVDGLVPVATNGKVTVTVNPANLSNGANKAYIGFFISASGAYVGFITVEIDCTPQPTITLTPPGTVSVQSAQGTSPGSIVLKSEVNAAGSGVVQFTMTPDTPSIYSPWIAYASVPGSPANTGKATPGVPEDLTVALNPTGLAAQPEPYVGYVHIRDVKTGQGAADLTVQLTVAAPITGNVTLPHYAVNGVYMTDFYLVNTAAQAANYTIYFFDDGGNPFSVLVQGQGLVNHVSGQLQPNGSAFFEAGDPAIASSSGGSAQVVADPSVGVQALFRLHLQNSTGSHYFEAAVPATSGSKEFEIPLDFATFTPTGEQIYTGVAISNLDSANSSGISCTARDSSGNIIPNAVQVPLIAPRGHWAGYNFPALLGIRGTLDCTGTTVIGAVGLQAYAVSGEISSLPVFLK
jgi:hypothetical protein